MHQRDSFEAVPADESTSLLPPLERTQSRPTRIRDSRLSGDGLKAAVAFVMALVCCGCGNSITLFSMFAPGFQHRLGYSLLDINNISIAAALGMYLPVPVLGYVADKMGPGILALVSIVLFTPAYYLAAVLSDPVTLEDAAANYQALAIAFAFIGAATSALYFSSVITCARVFSKSPGLSISAPVACYGLSSLWQAQLISRFFFSESGDINLSQTFKFFSILYFFTGILSFVSTRVGGVIGPAQQNPKDGLSLTNDDEDVGSIAESPQDMIYKRHETVSQFLQDHTAWMLFAAFVLSSGPLEMYLNNMGMLLSTVPNNPSVSTQVSVFSAFSTVARLGVGVVSDLLKNKISRPTILAAILYATAITHFLLATGLFTIFRDGEYFFMSSLVNGFTYGANYTLIPTIIACTWGVENLGTHYGLFIIGPAIGSSSFGFLFARVYDAASKAASNLLATVAGEAAKSCTGRACYEITFISTGASLFLSGFLLTIVWLFAWKPSGLRS